ncbi:acyltransferase [uncultured Rhodoblastus sp.]|uniref:acyltransferase family protein n=1 Tax=uncultured Rhodoblastus sp. TaxID=543037 RepID=UPI0025DF1EC3|nr:acyltransferase [uncultured Rhodoblastus sp.]
MILLGQVQGRDNNFFLIRILAAFTVLFAHSHSLATTEPYYDFLTPLGFKTGAIAVHIFFFTSGFFITGSLVSRDNIIDFAWARFMRIFPALWLMLLVTVVFIGLFITTLPAGEFFSSQMTHEFVRRCATLVNGIRYQLPGAFETNPYPIAVNGSLWTMPIEWRMYEYLAGAWMLFVLKPSWRPAAFRIGFPLATLALMAIAFATFNLHDLRNDGQIGIAEFFAGSSLYVWRDRIALSRGRLALMFGALCLAALNRQAFFIVYLMVLGPMTLSLAYLFGGFIRKFNRLGDYSYGVYIYAFPVQQSLAALIPGISVNRMNVYASLITLTLAVISWHLVEKPALDRKFIAAAATQRLFDFCRAGLTDLRRRIVA